MFHKSDGTGAITISRLPVLWSMRRTSLQGTPSAWRDVVHRSTPPSSCRVGPGNFTPSPSQIPDLILSHHPARAIARRLPPSAEPSGSSRCNPVGPSSTAMTRPLRSTGITPLHHYYGAVRPSPAHRYFQPRGWSRLCFFPWHRRPGSHVPYKLTTGTTDPQLMKRC